MNRIVVRVLGSIFSLFFFACDNGNGLCEAPPQHIEVHSFAGAFTSTELTLALRQPSGTTFLPGYAFTDPLKGAGQYRALEKEPTDCAPLEVAISSYSGDMQFLASEEMEMLRISKPQAEIVWTRQKGTTPTLEDYFSDNWVELLLLLVDCSEFGRYYTCPIASELPPGTVGKLADVKEGYFEEAEMVFLVWRTKS